METVKVLMDCGAKIAARDDYGRTPFHAAASYGNKDIVVLFLENGADINAPSGREGTPLHHAATLGKYIEVIETLLEHGADVKARGIGGTTALHLAVTSSSTHTNAMTKLLLEKGAELDAKDDEGWTALHYSAIWGDNEVISTLLHAELPLQSVVDIQNESQLFKTLTSLHPVDFVFQSRLGDALCAEGKYIDALITYNLSIELIPENATISQVDEVQHGGVPCRNCEAGIAGVRYHCVSCERFDLCTVCHLNPDRVQHSAESSHWFLRIPSDEWVNNMILSGKFNMIEKEVQKE